MRVSTRAGRESRRNTADTNASSLSGHPEGKQLFTKNVRAGGLALTASLIVSMLCACSSDPENTATKECPEGVVTLTVLGAPTHHPTPEQINAYREENPCVDFKKNEVPFNQYLAKLPVALSASNPPDIFSVDAPAIASYQSKGTLLALDDYLPADYRTDLNSADLEETSVDGKTYAIPTAQVGLAMFYNKELTDTAGIEVPTGLDDAWTWPEARDAMLQCQEAAGGSTQGLASGLFAASTANNAYRDLAMMRSAGDPDADPESSAYKTFAGVSEDKTTVDGYLNTPEMVEAATFYQGLFNGDDAVSSPTIVQNSFQNGTACFDISAAGVIGPLDDLSFPVGVSPVPYFTAPIIHTGTINLAVSPKSKHVEEAAKAVVAMSTGDIGLETAEREQSIPILKSMLHEATWLSEEPSALIVKELEAWGRPRPVNAHYEKYDLYVGTALHDIMTGADPQGALDKAVEQIDSELGS